MAAVTAAEDPSECMELGLPECSSTTTGRVRCGFHNAAQAALKTKDGLKTIVELVSVEHGTVAATQLYAPPTLQR